MQWEGQAIKGYGIESTDCMTVQCSIEHCDCAVNFSTRMMEIQEQLTQRAIEILALPDDKPCYLLDIG